MYSPVFFGICLLVAAVCLQVGENDVSKKQIVRVSQQDVQNHPY